MRLVPPFDRIGHIDSRAEAKVAGLLNQIDVDGPACCLYSVHLPRHEYKAMTEIDFLLVWDDTVLVIEVKGGRIGRRDGLWTFTDRYGHTNTKREGPFDQARTAMFSLRDRLTRQLPELDVAFGYLVLTPDQNLAPDLEWDPQIVGGPSSMTVAALGKTLQVARRYWLDKKGRRPAGHAYRDLTRVLRPDFDRVPSFAAQVDTLEDDYIRLAERQYDLLIAAEGNPRIVCTGGAGSGKTLLAVETARRAAADGSRVLLVCRSPRLADRINEALQGSGVRCVPADQATSHGPVDVLVVDEAQDLLDVDSYLRLDSLVVGGWARGRWRLFCDVNNQAWVDGTFDPDVFNELTASAMTVDLPFNCRNTATIVTQTQLLTGADLGVARAGHGPAVGYRRAADDTAAAAELDTQLRRLRADEVPPDSIVVISLRDRTEDSAATLSEAYRRHRLVAAESADLTSRPGPTQLLTAAQIKGLEAAHVCVIDVDDTSTALSRARLYVAMTRARISLWICLAPRAWDQLAETPSTGASR